MKTRNTILAFAVLLTSALLVAGGGRVVERLHPLRTLSRQSQLELSVDVFKKALTQNKPEYAEDLFSQVVLVNGVPQGRGEAFQALATSLRSGFLALQETGAHAPTGGRALGAEIPDVSMGGDQCQVRVVVGTPANAIGSVAPSTDSDTLVISFLVINDRWRVTAVQVGGQGVR